MPRTVRPFLKLTRRQAVEQMGNSAGATDEAFAKLDTTSNQAKIALNEVVP